MLLNTPEKVHLISDTHFFHKNIINFREPEDKNFDHPFRYNFFSDVDEMNSIIVKNINSVVQKSDDLIFLGDVLMGPKKPFLELFKKINGRKFLIAGNHDDIRFYHKEILFHRIMSSAEIRGSQYGYSGITLILSHIPIHPSCLSTRTNEETKVNVHGHLHNYDIRDSRYINLSVEAIEYKPLSLKDIFERILNSK
jgi:calcineurin-like phosphoesterase family protein